MAQSLSGSPFPRKSRSRIGTVIFALVVPVLPCIIIGLIFLLPSLTPFTSYVQGQCTITDKSLLYSFGRNGKTYAPDFQFTVQTTDGHTYQSGGYTAVPDSLSQDGAQAILDRYQFGDTYPCWYDPAHPTHAVLVRELSLVGLVALSGGLTIEVMLVVILLIGRRKARSRKKVQETYSERGGQRDSIQL